MFGIFKLIIIFLGYLIDINSNTIITVPPVNITRGKGGS